MVSTTPYLQRWACRVARQARLLSARPPPRLPEPRLTCTSMDLVADRGRDHTPLTHSHLNPNHEDERGESRGRGFNASGRGEYSPSLSFHAKP